MPAVWPRRNECPCLLGRNLGRATAEVVPCNPSGCNAAPVQADGRLADASRGMTGAPPMRYPLWRGGDRATEHLLKPWEGCVEIFNRRRSRSTGALPLLSSWLLIGPHNSNSRSLSIQISEVPAGSEQPMHAHAPEQCYYIIRGQGLVIVGDEIREVSAGDAVYIPSGRSHGIRNLGNDVLEYLTANSPAFSKEYENAHWPAHPE